MIIRNHSIDPFTPEAARRWERIPPWAQERILGNVWCGQCRGPVTILLKTAEMVQKDLVLRGKCEKCGAEVCRVVEPEPE
ncbi:MAG: hypothetical protein JW741_20055 [Sedimentisphaerales bacterium]|nr:hypothetical protein [Sedimentisphaerales bacterium]